jgi:hypothetical protein
MNFASNDIDWNSVWMALHEKNAECPEDEGTAPRSGPHEIVPVRF